MQKEKALTLLQVASRLDVHPGTVDRWCIEGKLKSENIEGKLYIEEYNLRDFLLKKKDRAETFLLLFDSFRKFKEKILDQAEKFFGDEPGCVMGLSPGGIPYALCLYFALPEGKDITFISPSEEHIYNSSLIQERKILVVDDSTRTGESINTVKKVLESIDGLNIKEIKIAVYDDFAGCADFAVRRLSYEEHSKSLMLTLEQFKL